MRQARAEIDAIDIAPDFDAARQFRSQYLRMKLLPIDAVKDRLEDWRMAQPNPLVAPEWPEDKPFPPLHPFTVEVRKPDTPVDEPPLQFRFDIVKEGVLGSLQGAANFTARIFGWTEASAAGWILTGSLPIVPEMEIFRIPREFEARQRWQSIKMTVPVDVPPSVLARRYAIEREKAIEELPWMAGNPVGEKALNACTFALTRNDGSSWEQTFEQWSSQLPATEGSKRVSFRSARNFAYSARETYFRLTGRRLKWNRSRGKRDS